MSRHGMSRNLAAAAEATAPISTREEIAEIVHEVVNSLSGELTIGEFKLFHEVEGLARFIHSAKQEILNIRPDDISLAHIPEATIELDAVVAAAANATGIILDRAEELDRLGASLDKETAAKINEAVTAIFEACNFQDITGQRITKVVRTLRYIESKVDNLVKAFGSEFGDLEPAPGVPEPEGDAALLHGPQLTENANSQADIDAILAGLF